MHAETPNIQIADSLMCVDNLKQLIKSAQHPIKFKAVQTKLYEIQGWQESIAAFYPVNFGGNNTSLAKLTIFSQLIGLNFIPIAKPEPKENHTIKSVNGKKKKRILLNASDSDDSPTREQKAAIEAAKQGKTFIEHGVVTKLKDEAKLSKGAIEAIATPKYLGAMTLAEYLFEDERGKPQITTELAVNAYSSYTKVFKNALEHFK